MHSFVNSTCGQDDRGSSNPILKLKDSFADAISKAEKAVPRSQKFQILNNLRHKVTASAKTKHDPTQLLALANEYKRFRFYEEAIQLYREVAENDKYDSLSLMSANRWLSEIEFVANNNVKAAISHLQKAISFSPEKSVARGQLLGKLGSYYFISEQTAQMLDVFEQFNELPVAVKNAIPDSHLKANLYSGRFSDDPKKAAAFLKMASKIAEDRPDLFPADFVLSVFLERAEKLPWNAPERIENLVRVFENEKYAKTPQIRNVAVEILLAYYLDAGKEWKRFDRHAQATLELLASYESKAEKDSQTARLYCQTLGISVGGADENKKDWKRSKLTKDFEEWNEKVKLMQFYLPKGTSRSETKRIIEAFTRGSKLLNPGKPEKTQRKKQGRN